MSNEIAAYLIYFSIVLKVILINKLTSHQSTAAQDPLSNCLNALWPTSQKVCSPLRYRFHHVTSELHCNVIDAVRWLFCKGFQK